MFRHTHAVRQVLTREEVGRSLIDEVKSASKTVRGRKRPKLLSPRETLEASAVLRDKRMQLMEQGKKIPDNLKSASERNWQRRLSQLESREPGVVAKAKRMLLETPEKRQFIARNNFCTQVNAVDTGLHPVALHRFWEIVKAAPQGLLRYHVREIVPIIEDRMKESRFQDFFDSSDIEILKRRGYVFEGRDGEPLKLTLEELRLAREADSYRKIDPRGKARMRWLLDRKKDLASKKLAKTPIFRPVVYSEGDALAYLGYRLCPIYAVMMRVFGEIVSRVPRFAPRSMLDFGAGWGTCIFAAVEVWKGIATTQERNTREKFYKKKIEHHGHREGLVHPRLVDDGLRELMKDLLGKEVDSLEKKAAEIKGQVEIGLLPSGCDVEADDAVRERRKLLDDEAIWESCQQWKGKEAREPEGAADDFFGDGMYSGPTREFEETDYFLEKDHGSYPMPGKAEALEKRGVSPQMYLKWFNVREKWAAKYYQHVEKNKMERDPSYRPYSALQYLYGRSETEQPDKALQSEKLHEDDPLEGEDKAIVYRHWDKRIPDLLSRITAVEPSQPMMNYGLDFLTEAAPNVVWQRFLKDGSTATQRNASDLVTCAYTLSELQSEELRADAVRSLWEHCTGLLVIVEAGTPAGFKLVIDARQTILEEYGGIGPWETQPTVVAPCPHDNLRCPVAYSLQGRSHKKLRTCHSTARYSPSFVENWVRGAHETFRDEEYSYCVLGRNEVAPEKSLRPPPKREIRPTVITENPAKAGDDPRIKKVLESPEELAMWHSHGNRRKVEADLYEPELYLPVPETEENLNPFTGKYRKYGKNATAKDVITAYKEAAEYTEEYRKRSWNWDRVVRPTRTGKLGNVTIDVCTPHATQERFTVIRNREKLDKLAAAAMPGSLFPYYTGTARYEFVQGDAPNTFAQPDSHLNPIEHQKLAEAVQSAQKEEEADADDETFSAEDVAWKRSMQQRLDNAASDPDLAEEIRAELKTLRYHPK